MGPSTSSGAENGDIEKEVDVSVVKTVGSRTPMDENDKTNSVSVDANGLASATLNPISRVDRLYGRCFNPTVVVRFDIVDLSHEHPRKKTYDNGTECAEKGTPGVDTKALSANDGFAITETNIKDPKTRQTQKPPTPWPPR